jgi:ComF family protein
MPLLTSFLDLLYPRSCSGCGGALSGGEGHICWDCLAGCDVITHPFCSVCGDPVDGRVDQEYVCSSCLDHPPWFDVARSAARHRGSLRHAMYAFKYGRHAGLSSDLMGLALSCVRTHFPKQHLDAVTFVPLYPRKEKERTYNQSRLLASGLARSLALPLASRCLCRSRRTLTQAGLNARERRRNVKGAFAAREHEWLEGRSLLLVDDVMTTGATVNECARALKKGGASRVLVVTVARG